MPYNELDRFIPIPISMMVDYFRKSNVILTISLHNEIELGGGGIIITFVQLSSKINKLITLCQMCLVLKIVMTNDNKEESVESFFCLFNGKLRAKKTEN